MSKEFTKTFMLDESNKTFYLYLPVHTTLSNLHVWFLFASKILFEDYQLSPSFIIKTEKEFTPLMPVLGFMEQWLRHFGSFRQLVSPVMDMCSEEDRVITVGYGEWLQRTWTDSCLDMVADIGEFLSEAGMPSLSTSKDDSRLFRLWYEGKFEPTSAPHFNAYIQCARKKERLSRISLLLTTYPTNSNILAVKIRPSNCKHTAKMYMGETKAWYCMTCSMEVAEEDVKPYEIVSTY